MTAAQERYYMASQWRMMWWKLKRHRIAVLSGIVLLVMYLSIMVSELLSPYGSHSRHSDFIFAPPQGIHLFHEGRFVGPFVYGYAYHFAMPNLRRACTPMPSKIH